MLLYMTEQVTLARYVEDLHARVGKPSCRVIALEVSLSHTSIARMLKGEQLARWHSVEKLLRYLDADLEMAKRLWVEMFRPEAPLWARGVSPSGLSRSGLDETNRLLGLVVDRLDEVLRRLPPRRADVEE